MERDKDVNDAVTGRVWQHKCLTCESDDPTRRGLCSKCYQQYRRVLAGLTKAQQLQVERAAIEQGKLLDRGEVHAINAPNPFRELVA